MDCGGKPPDILVGKNKTLLQVALKIGE